MWPWESSTFPLDNCQCSHGLWWINMLWLAPKETPVMFQGKMTSSLLNQEEKITERLSFIAYKVNDSLMFLFLECPYSVYGISTFWLTKKNKNWVRRCMSGCLQLGRSTSLTIYQDKGYSQVLLGPFRTTCSHYCLPKSLTGWFLAYLAGRHASFNINSPCDIPFPSNRSSDTWR